MDLTNHVALMKPDAKTLTFYDSIDVKFRQAKLICGNRSHNSLRDWMVVWCGMQAGSVLFLDLGASYMGIFILWQFIIVYVQVLCTFLYVLYFH